jgi:hypothetical protein
MPLTLEQIARRVELNAPITPPEAALFVGVAPETIITWIKTGLLKAANVAKAKRPSYRIMPVDLLAFLESRAEVPRTHSFRARA